jgi:hypothetical protein
MALLLLGQVFVVEVVGDRHRTLIPACPLARLVSADQEDGFPLGIEHEKNAHGPTYRSQLLHVVVAAGFDPIHERTSEGRALGL